MAGQRQRPLIQRKQAGTGSSGPTYSRTRVPPWHQTYGRSSSVADLSVTDNRFPGLASLCSPAPNVLQHRRGDSRSQTADSDLKEAEALDIPTPVTGHDELIGLVQQNV